MKTKSYIDQQGDCLVTVTDRSPSRLSPQRRVYKTKTSGLNSGKLVTVTDEEESSYEERGYPTKYYRDDSLERSYEEEASPREEWRGRKTKYYEEDRSLEKDRSYGRKRARRTVEVSRGYENEHDEFASPFRYSATKGSTRVPGGGVIERREYVERVPERELSRSPARYEVRREPASPAYREKQSYSKLYEKRSRSPKYEKRTRSPKYERSARSPKYEPITKKSYREESYGTPMNMSNMNKMRGTSRTIVKETEIYGDEAPIMKTSVYENGVLVDENTNEMREVSTPASYQNRTYESPVTRSRHTRAHKTSPKAYHKRDYTYTEPRAAKEHSPQRAYERKQYHYDSPQKRTRVQYSDSEGSLSPTTGMRYSVSPERRHYGRDNFEPVSEVREEIHRPQYTRKRRESSPRRERGLEYSSPSFKKSYGQRSRRTLEGPRYEEHRYEEPRYDQERSAFRKSKVGSRGSGKPFRYEKTVIQTSGGSDVDPEIVEREAERAIYQSQRMVDDLIEETKMRLDQAKTSYRDISRVLTPRKKSRRVHERSTAGSFGEYV
jgi:hypothetical protein